jgi:micrococcal nuclease
MWVALVAGIFYFEYDFGGVQSVNPPMGQSTVTTDHKFTFCGGLSQRYCVVDGDTIRFAGIKIRVADIDTPEIHDYKCEHELKRGLRAKTRLLELVNEGPFTLVSTGGDDADQYGRKLRRLMRNGLSLGEFLIDEGLARRYAGGRLSWCL